MQKRSVILLILFFLVLISIPVYSFLIRPNLDNQVDWVMHGVVVNTNGEVNQKTEYQIGQFTFSASVQDHEDKTATLNTRIVATDKFRYFFNSSNNPTDHTEHLSTNRKYFDHPYYVYSEFQYDTVGNTSIRADIAIDFEKEYMIINWHDDQDLYLVASTDPNTDPQEILAHFEGFIAEYDESHVNG